MHGERVHASSRRHTPHFDRLVAARRHDGGAIRANQDVAHIIRVADELCDALAAPGIPQAYNALRASAGDD